ncbi:MULTISPECIES: O-succinylhomoserine sulfhydrylase [Acinetobacter]|jgi:O-succinylhomoserine sulfhydrylase|uniref:O-succinylhomoserine sulfhydrylase n=1 Tax=Acinetobacter bereziniae LMG 1003 = CIP 70.12 TaxID=981324 RepID=N9EKF4_ACIBZ|nr:MULTISPECIES: O-succinylhomoserine sulfhydrylase [Acinetobacter]ENV95389.1 O-succinylhomoserine sulfhydrylase [Acinetobacter bereziniae LMG 1003 = CIP 70.12]MBI0393801.1 O-succinylhomoserine sulfhydrylase [Acinetobacter bereziniae]MBJ8423062.1 O-succinylhomoserine sulfhydrylase [Acinetobacter bereziniae]MBJ8553913.1 O-succinylhomoserine sulfhydrylase [Acinetobacter bereziniae]MBJ9372711.1 O-succinylhomoserine sulfhydrylase [Acinetobacter sp. TGL-Y2]
MSQHDDIEYQLDTLAIRTGHTRSFEGEHGEPIFLTSSFVYENAAEAAAKFSGAEPGNIYSRFTNPTVTMFEKRLAALEGGERAVATSSGMAAIMAVAMSFLKAGDHVICSRAVFGSTVALFEKYVAKFNVAVTFVDLTDLSAWQAAVRPETKLLFVESPSNPLAEVADIQALSDLAHANDALLAIDNSFCTPILQRPLQFGADLVIYSATKYLDGQGRALGGAVVGSHKLLEEVFGYVRTTGPSMSPFNAWVFLKGLETLRLRMKAHSESAQIIAEWLVKHPKVEKVYFAGLPEHVGHELAAKQQTGFGGIVSFEVKGEREGAWKVIDHTQFISITGNLGDAKSTITHPATTTHGKLSPEAKAAAGIREGLIRLSVGLEDVNDIIRDLSHGLDLI